MKFNIFQKRSKKTLELPFSILQKALQYDNLNIKNNSTIIFCTNLISNLISTLPFSIYYENEKGNKIEAKYHNAYKLIQRPNVNETWTIFINAIIRDIIFSGNAFIYKIINKNEISQLVRIPPKNVEVKLNGLEKQYYIKNSQTLLTDKNIIHIPSFFNYTIAGGQSIVDYAKEYILTSATMQQYINYFYNNSPFSRYKIDFNNSEFRDLSKDKISEFTDFFTYLASQANAGKPLVEYKGVKIVPTDFKDADISSLRENKTEVEKDIATLMGVPFALINADASKYQDLSMNFLKIFISTTLSAYTDRIASVFKYSLLNENEYDNYNFEFDYSELLKGNQKEFVDSVTNLQKNGIITINEARKELGWNTTTEIGSDKHIVNGVGVLENIIQQKNKE